MSPRLLLLAALTLADARPRGIPAAPFGVQASAAAPAPRVSVTDLEGAPADLSPRPGEVMLVTFWATWCQTCRAELPSLVALGRELSARHAGRFRFVGVSMDEERAPVRSYVRALERAVRQLGWTVVVDGLDQAALAAYYTAARGAKIPDEYQLPQTYVVGASGRLVGWLEGPRDWSSPAARAYLERLLGTGPGSVGLTRPPARDR